MVKPIEHTPANIRRALVALIDLWDQSADEPWTVEDGRRPSNVALISAYAHHVVNLSRAVLTLHKEGLEFEFVGLVRSSMECVATTSWLYLFPEKTSQLVVYSSGQLVKVVEEFERAGYDIGDDTVAAEHKGLVEALGKPDDAEAKELWRRFASVAGGRQLYAVYRVLCSLDHATNTLADQYTEDNGQGTPRLLTRARDDIGPSSATYIGTQALMLLRAQIAADLILKKRRHSAQLDDWATRLGVDPRIIKATDLEVAEADAAASEDDAPTS